MLPEGDDDVPVYEPLYPDKKTECSHPNCNGETPPANRLCDGCISLLQSSGLDECPHCGQKA